MTTPRRILWISLFFGAAVFVVRHGVPPGPQWLCHSHIDQPTAQVNAKAFEESSVEDRFSFLKERGYSFPSVLVRGAGPQAGSLQFQMGFQRIAE